MGILSVAGCWGGGVATKVERGIGNTDGGKGGGGVGHRGGGGVRGCVKPGGGKKEVALGEARCGP